MLQSDTCSSGGQDLPPKVGWMNLRERVLRPSPQVAVQEVQWPQPPFETDMSGAQSVGHGLWLHGTDFSSAGQAAPSWRAGWVMARRTVCEPVPQDRLHGDAFRYCQGPTSQLIGHALPPQGNVSSR